MRVLCGTAAGLARDSVALCDDQCLAIAGELQLTGMAPCPHRGSSCRGSDRRQRCAIGVRLDPEQRRCQRVMTRGLHLRSGACACNTVASPATQWQAHRCSRQICALRGGVTADRRRERARRGPGSAGDRAGPADTMRWPSGAARPMSSAPRPNSRPAPSSPSATSTSIGPAAQLPAGPAAESQALSGHLPNGATGIRARRRDAERRGRVLRRARWRGPLPAHPDRPPWSARTAMSPTRRRRPWRAAHAGARARARAPAGAPGRTRRSPCPRSGVPGTTRRRCCHVGSLPGVCRHSSRCGDRRVDWSHYHELLVERILPMLTARRVELYQPREPSRSGSDARQSLRPGTNSQAPTPSVAAPCDGVDRGAGVGDHMIDVAEREAVRGVLPAVGGAGRQAHCADGSLPCTPLT